CRGTPTRRRTHGGGRRSTPGGPGYRRPHLGRRADEPPAAGAPTNGWGDGGPAVGGALPAPDGPEGGRTQQQHNTRRVVDGASRAAAVGGDGPHDTSGGSQAQVGVVVPLRQASAWLRRCRAGAVHVHGADEKRRAVGAAEGVHEGLGAGRVER